MTHLALSVLFMAVLSAPATAAPKVYFVGSLNTSDQFIDSFEGFRSGMAELGYRDGENVRYHYYNSRGNDELLRIATQRLIQDGVDLIVTSSTTATVVAAKATEGTNIPVLFLSAGNAQKLVKNFSSSGTNLAGISSASVELTGKRFELLKELSPRAKRVAIPLNPKGVNYQTIVAETTDAAGKLGLSITELHVRSVQDVARIAAGITQKHYDAVFQPADSLISEALEPLVSQSIKERLPCIASLLVNVRRGCLATYAADYVALGRQAAVLADKILKGTRPADLPIELPHRLNLIINLKTARAIGMAVSKEILLRADEVIE
ncbi:MAG TPA: ABC transporter substrate-binding protein [Candidatus Eisenbacteria bacterium]|nr:ABC transporter substrate-binding protein [Candidatus Eisenbacteria bacterium]